MRLAAVMLLFKEQAFIEASVRAIYPQVDSICCATARDRNYAGQPLEPDRSIETLLEIPDPDNKIRLVVRRDWSDVPGDESEARMRNAAMMLDPKADYYLIVDTDEIWEGKVLREAWDYVQKTRWAGYRVSSHAYFRKWNYRIVEPEPGYRPLAFLRRGFQFLQQRQVEWHGPARWREYFRTGRKPKMVCLPTHLRMQHGSCVGNDERILTKLRNYGHADLIDPTWFDRVWKNFHPGIRNFHYYPGAGHLYESLVAIATADLPDEVKRCSWPEGWIER